MSNVDNYLETVDKSKSDIKIGRLAQIGGPCELGIMPPHYPKLTNFENKCPAWTSKHG